MQITTSQVILRPQAVQHASSIIGAFEKAGFTVGPFLANNFSIAGSAQLFEKFFGVTPAETLEASKDYELPLNALPSEVQSSVQAIVVTRRPDFGPGNY